jgi:hypothetical protein
MEKKRRSEYVAMALLLDMTYSEQYHCMIPAVRKYGEPVVCPDTLELLDFNAWSKRNNPHREYPPEVSDD